MNSVFFGILKKLVVLKQTFNDRSERPYTSKNSREISIFAELIKRTGKDIQGLSLILSVIRAFATRGELDIAKRLN
ncbi:hypothetical protein MUK42_06045, partial [Musa troglodytarum]